MSEVRTSADDGGAGNTAAPPRPDAASEAALRRHADRMRPLRRIYAATLGLLAAAVVAVVVVAYQHGEINHVTLHTVAGAPPTLALEPPSAHLTVAWTSPDTTALGTPYYEGTVVTHDRRTVRGRDARTGAQTWSYTRTDRIVCAAIQTEGVTVAVYRLHGNCDELTGLDSGTGARLWTRTLDKDGAQFDGPASYSVQPGNILFVSATSLYAVATSGTASNGDGGLDYWTFHHTGCTITGAVLGVGGALISQNCAHQNCDGHKFCGNGRQLLLREATKGYDDNSSTNKNNPDQIVWNRFGSDLVPTSAGRQLAAREPGGGALDLLDPKTGKSTATLALDAISGASAPAAATSAADGDLIWVGGRTYALPAGQSRFSWQADTVSVPTVTDPEGLVTPTLQAARVAAGTASGIAEFDATTGTVRQSRSVGAPRPGSLVYPFGTGYLVAGPTTVRYS